MKDNIYCVILAGGSGTRLWPLSKVSMPKQFIDLVGCGRTMLQLTYDRFRAMCDSSRFIVVTRAEFAGIVAKQLPSLPAENILCEPFKCNTSAAIALANAFVKQRDPNAVMVVTPSDHLILNDSLFIDTVRVAASHAAKSDVLMTIGIKATRPETAYGYIQVGRELDGNEVHVIHEAKTFTEKPNEDIAQTFFECGDFCWNSGVFLWRLPVITEAMRRFLPDMQRQFDTLDNVPSSQWADGALRNVYEQCESISIDYGIFEKARNVAVCLADVAWNDLGGWDALFEQASKDERTNVVLAGNVLVKDSSGCLVSVDPGTEVVVDGLKDYMLVQHDGVTIVCPRSKGKQAWRYVAELRAGQSD